MSKKLNYRKSDQQIIEDRKRNERYTGGLVALARYAPTKTDEAKRAMEVLKAYTGTSRFMLDLANKVQRGGGLFVPSAKQAEVALKIAAENAA